MPRKTDTETDTRSSRPRRDNRGRPRPHARGHAKGQAHGHADRHEGERIAKVMARAGLCSRRDAEDWIAAGRVAVNGAVIASPALNVTARDRITVDGAALPQRERTRLFLYHKPRGLVTTNADPEGRPTVFERLPAHLPRLLTVGRLDIGTEGLLLLTNDGGLARVLELPETGWLRRYRVRALGRVTQADLDALREGVTVDGVHYGPVEATLDREQGSNVWLTFAIREGKNREVRNVLAHLGLQVNRLIRVSYGPFQLGELAEGEVVEVRTRVLRDQLGERVAEQANTDFSSPVIDRPRDEGPRLAPPPDRPVRRDGRSAERDRGERPRRDDRDRPRGERGRDERRAARFGGHHGPRSGRDQGERDRDRPRGKWRSDEKRRDGRPERSRSFGDDRPRTGRNRRDERRGGGERPEKPEGRPRRGHAWRAEDAPLRRHYRGSFKDERGSFKDERGERKAEHQPNRDATADKRAGLVTDRKGRRVLVERLGAGRKPPAEKPRGGRPHKRGKRPYRPDRSRGPRPSRPKPKSPT